MKLPLRNLILMMMMVAASGMAIALKPTKKIADQGPKVELETLIPTSFGEWRQDIASVTQAVDPQQKEMLEKIYNQTLSRTYVNAQGYRIMLAVAYGGDQGDAMQVHKPEVCYPAQGFTLHGKHADTLQVRGGDLPITRVSTSLGNRNEPVTYWITIGDTVIKSGGIEKKLVEMSYGLSGKVPDGMLVRVSSIDPDKASAYQMHDRFSKQMLGGIAPEARWRLAGKLGSE
ncbi:exosortase-associated protein EpsI, B-type [Accumulibacter sp.]|uniref:exosortase-associated protein EpsI, B-type n=1 Tax=Accumulibacter sp. TaxID=2053492 RepID=UPI0025DD4375|nr:exosortase-associated protein EpsI, B-type [Accumulibacter sp.]MCM8611620.1 EpsI family protein [Accumulibacter sp.]MCM8635385.1 EpsI family protein [Accumulibacter sp.]MCM8638990.1 EpsI family protein [Accumulibacter sp.]